MRPACLVLVSSYVDSLHLAVAPQSGAKDQFYCTVYYLNLNSNCEAQGVSKIMNLIAYYISMVLLDVDFYQSWELFCRSEHP